MLFVSSDVRFFSRQYNYAAYIHFPHSGLPRGAPWSEPDAHTTSYSVIRVLFASRGTPPPGGSAGCAVDCATAMAILDGNVRRSTSALPLDVAESLSHRLS